MRICSARRTNVSVSVSVPLPASAWRIARSASGTPYPSRSSALSAASAPAGTAMGGASVNYLFIEHFQETAQGHFTVRRLERAYGKDIVRAEYERLAQKH